MTTYVPIIAILISSLATWIKVYPWLEYRSACTRKWLNGQLSAGYFALNYGLSGRGYA
jgi:hypothetical protein